MKSPKSHKIPKISVIIVSYNTANETLKCIKAVKSSTGLTNKEIEIIVVDNASTDNTVSIIHKAHKDVILIENKTNLGFGTANNQGIKRATSPYILLLNSDAFVSKNTVSTLLNSFTQTDSLAASPRLIGKDGSLQYSCGNFPSLLRIFGWMFWLDRLPVFNRIIGQYHIVNHAYYMTDRRPDWVTGACVLFRKEDLVLVGGFDENIFMYGEELDLFIRMHLALKRKCLYIAGTSVIHIGSLSTSSSGIPKLALELKGIEYIYKKHYNHLAGIATFLIKIGALLKMSVYSLLPERKSDHEEYKKYFDLA